MLDRRPDRAWFRDLLQANGGLLVDLHRWAPAVLHMYSQWHPWRQPAPHKRASAREPLCACPMHRRFHPHRKGDYSVWNMKTLARARNHGSRVDFVLAGSRDAEEVGHCCRHCCRIPAHTDSYGSTVDDGRGLRPGGCRQRQGQPSWRCSAALASWMTLRARTMHPCMRTCSYRSLFQEGHRHLL